jgi:predicted ATPase
MRRVIDGARTMGAEIDAPRVLAWLAELYGQAGQIEEGLRVLTEALARGNKNEERQWEAEVYRLKGELLLVQKSRTSKVKGQRAKVVEAERCFQQAMDISHRQKAKSLELRATMSLARLWQQQGKKTQARELLASVYNWFTEGFDTADLQDAKALLGRC